MSKSSKISLNTDETICLPPETFYSCNIEDFDNETYFVKSKSVKTNDNKKETTKPRVNNSFTSFPFRKDIKEVLDNKVEEFSTNYNKKIQKERAKQDIVYDIDEVSDFELNSE